jgi:hypothetical protein
MGRQWKKAGWQAWFKAHQWNGLPAQKASGFGLQDPVSYRYSHCQLQLGQDHHYLGVGENNEQG